MSFLSRSSKNSHYRHPNYGGVHYQQHGGLFGKLLRHLGSFSSKNHGFQNGNYPNQHFSSTPNPPPQFNVIICTKCGSQVPEGSKFCLECGEKMNTCSFCPSCRENLPAGAKFCMKCGQKLI